MADPLIREIPDHVVTALDAHAMRPGISRSDYVLRRLAADTVLPGAPVEVADLNRFSELFADLADPEVMEQAWR
jgi:hypothetical protein